MSAEPQEFDPLIWATRIAFFLLGTIAGILVNNFKFFTVDSQVNVGQLLTVAVTISVALYLNLVFQRRASTDAVRKAILIQLAKDVQTSLTDTYHASLVCHPTKKLTKDVADAITKKERCLSVNLSLLEEGLKHCYAFTLPELLEMKKIRLHLKKLLTDSPFPVGPINQDRQDRIQKTVKIMGSQCVKLIFSISSIDKPRL